MSLLDAAGLRPSMPEGDVGRRANLMLVEEAERFLGAGGVVTLTEWAALSQEERAALAVAGERLAATRAAQAGLAALGPAGIAKVLQVVDGGAALTRLRLEEAAAAAEVRT